MDLQLLERSFLVVGGTAGMGLAAAEALAVDGAAVAVAGRDAGRAGEAARRLLDLGAAADRTSVV